MRNQILALIAATSFVTCISGCGSSAGDQTGVTDDESEALTAGSPSSINIGFNGPPDQFGYVDDFFKESVRPGPRLCHTYIAWNAGDQPAQLGNANSTVGSRAYLEYWLHQAAGHCDEALISFKADHPGDAPKVTDFARAFDALASAPWEKLTGFKGALAFTAWNEPNNGGIAGNGLGQELPADTAAAYYLAAERSCQKNGCKVAAGDFASNGNMWNDFEWNCANDNVDPDNLCSAKSPYGGGKAASYLDRYKNYIANHADEYGLGKNFRPKYFAFHGWHDINEYLGNADHCVDYGHCGTRRILRSLSGSWEGAELWDTEVGVDQDGPSISDGEQACGAAFLIRMTAMSKRIGRVYYTRMHGGTGELMREHTPRAAMSVLAQRDTTAPGKCK